MFVIKTNKDKSKYITIRVTNFSSLLKCTVFYSN